jgi:hypothetical protein
MLPLFASFPCGNTIPQEKMAVVYHIPRLFVNGRAKNLKNAQLLRAAQMAAFSVSFLMFVLGFPFCCCPCGRLV